MGQPTHTHTQKRTCRFSVLLSEKKSPFYESNQWLKATVSLTGLVEWLDGQCIKTIAIPDNGGVADGMSG